MPTIRPANFPRISRPVKEPQQGVTQPQKPVTAPPKPVSEKPNSTVKGQAVAGDERVTMHASQAKVLKLYHPSKVQIKQPAKLGQFIDIKI